MAPMKNALAYAGEHRETALDMLLSFLRIPSISTLPENKNDIQHAAEWLAEQLTQLDFQDVQILPTSGHPVVFGQRTATDPEAPTLLVYGHYDVQPPDPLDEWESDPFEPTERGDNLYARGASDMKAQLVAHMNAIKAILASGDLPVNIKYMLEGEEEVGSPNLRAFMTEHKDLLACDLCLNVDLGISGPDEPSITYALRGLIYFEINLRSAVSDLHSGLFGGAVDNPAIVLSRLIAGMKDADGTITLPGFYDDVRPLDAAEREKKSPRDDTWWLERTGTLILFGEPGYTAEERATARPTLDVNGFLSGFTGEGAKTVLPATAMAKISMRLVADQDPEAIHESMQRYLEENAPESVEWTLKSLSSCRPSFVERDSTGVQAGVQALEEIWDAPVEFVRMGGSIPVVGLIQEILGVDSVLLGFALPDDNIHAPNEKQHLPTFYRGIDAYIRFTYHLADMYKV